MAYVKGKKVGSTTITATYNSKTSDGTLLTVTAPVTTVTFNKVNGTGGTSSTSITYGTAAANYPAITLPTRTGYTFNGYYDASSGGTQYFTSAGAGVITWDKVVDTTLYAQWTANNYTVTFHPDGGILVNSPSGDGNWGSNANTTNDSSVTVTFDSGNYCGMGVASKSGYTFLGWYDSDGVQVFYDTGLCVPNTDYWGNSQCGPWKYAGNVDLYAHYTVNSYAVGFQHWTWGWENGEGNNSNQQGYLLGIISTRTAEYGSSVTVDENDAVEIPNGFYLHQAGNTGDLSSDGSWHLYDFPVTFTMPAKNVGFEYDYSPNEYTITYNLNGGTAGANTPSTYNVIYGAQLVNPTRTGYTFDGWYETSDFSGSAVTGYNTTALSFSSVSELYTALESRTTGNKTLYAKWTANDYTITFHPEGGTLVNASDGTGNWGVNLNTTNDSEVTVTFGSTNYYGMGVASKTRYTFKGWYTATSGGVQVYGANGLCITGTSYWDSSCAWCYDGDVDLYAQYEANTVAIPTTISGLVYTGSLQFGVNGYDSSKMSGTTYSDDDSDAETISGLSAINAGDYYTVFTIGSDYMWSDGTTTDKTVSWTIEKSQATLPLTISGDSQEYHDIARATVSRDYTGGTLQYSKDNGTTWNNVSWYSGNLTSTPSRTAVGDVSIIFKVVGDSNHTDSAVSSPAITLSVYEADDARMTVSPCSADSDDIIMTYTGSNLTIATASDVHGIDTFYLGYSLVSDSVSDSDVTWGEANDYEIEAINAGEYYIYYKFTPDENHSNTKSCTYVGKTTILPKSISGSDITVSGSGTFTYDGSAKGPTITVADGTRGVNLVEGTDYTLSGNSQTNAGTYTVTVSGKGNYTGANTTYSFTIAQATPTFIKKDGNTIYPEIAYGKVTASVAGTATYSSSSSFTSTSDLSLTADTATTIVSRDTAGTNTVYAIFVPTSSNYASVGTSESGYLIVAATVKKKTPTITFTPNENDLTYNGSEQMLGTVNYDGDGTLLYSMTCNDVVVITSTEISDGTEIKATDAGEYEITINCRQGTNYSGISGSTYTKSISKATPTFIKKDGNTIYPEIAYGKVTASVAGTATYSSSSSFTSTSDLSLTADTATTIVSRDTAGTNTVYAYFTPTDTTNYNSVGSASSDYLTINAAVDKDECDVSVNPTSGTITYPATTTTFTIKRSGDGEISVSSSNTNIATVSISGTTVTVTRAGYGSATITVSVAEGTNYLASSENATYSITCAKAARSGVVSCEDVTYGQTVQASVSGNTENGEITWSISSDTGTAEILTDGTVIPTQAGTVTINASVAATTNYLAYTATPKSITISKSDISPIVSMSGYPYAGTKSTPSISGNTGNGTVTYYYNTTDSNSGGTLWSTVTSSTSLNAGTYYMYAVVGETTNYKGATSDTVSFIISKPDITPIVSMTGYTYDGTKTTPSISGNTGNGTVTYYYNTTNSNSGGTEWSTVSDAKSLNARTYYMYAVVGESTNFKGATSATVSFVISKADIVPTVSMSNYSYGQNELPSPSLGNGSNPGNGTVTYYYNTTNSNSGGTKWSNMTTTSLNAGTYYMYVVVGETTNYNGETSSTISFTVNKGTPTLSISLASNLGYTGSAQNLVTGASVTGNGQIYTGLGTDTTSPTTWVSWPTSCTGTSADIYYVWAKADESTNYNAVSATYQGTVGIGASTITIPAPTSYSGKYDTAYHSVVFGSTANASIDKYRHSTDNSNWTEVSTNPSWVNVGTHYVQAYYKADTNYTGSAWTASGSVAISQADAPTISWAPVTSNTVTFATTAQTVQTVTTASVATGGNTPTYSVVSNSTGYLTFNSSTRVLTLAASAPATTTGYAITLRASSSAISDNYKTPVSVDKTITVKVSKANGSATAPTDKASAYGSGETVATAGSGTGTMQYCLTSTSTTPSTGWSSTMPTVGSNNVGTYYLHYYVGESTNYNETTKTYITVTITRAKTATASAISGLIFNGSAQTGVMGDNVSWSGTTSATNASSYTAYATPGSNYAWSDGTYSQKQIDWTIGAKSIAGSDITVTLSPNSFTYNAATQGPSTITVYDSTRKVNLTKTTDYTVSNDSKTNAGTYSVTITGAGNYTGTNTSRSFTINKVTPTVVLTGSVVAYHNDATITTYAYYGDSSNPVYIPGKLYWGTSSASMTSTTSLGTSAATVVTRTSETDGVGTTTIYAYFVPTDTTNFKSEDGTTPYSAAAKIEQATDANISVTVSGGHLYSGSAQTIATVSSTHGVSSYTLGYTTSSSATVDDVVWGTENTTTISATNVGTYYIWYKFTADSSHSNNETGKRLDATCSIGNSLSIKVSGEWKDVVGVYIKVSGNWVLQSDISSVFDTEKYYMEKD